MSGVPCIILWSFSRLMEPKFYQENKYTYFGELNERDWRIPGQV